MAVSVHVISRFVPMFQTVVCVVYLLARIPSRLSSGLRFSGNFADDAASRPPRAASAASVAVCALALGAALSACSPTFDWRTIM
ncbi:MAG TPA: hypothetical protein VF573_20045, partial [Paraburkholderia sp.]